uniref:Putative von Willebrand domain containing protein n=1 Tax=viral metagenome TaxID=1070528 RepID=A0A6M3LB79_9ZZZZ
MPKLMTDNDTQMSVQGQGGFYFSAIRPDKLGATEYTLVSIVIDITGSVRPFADNLLTCLKTIIRACKKSPRADNLLIRTTTFNTKVYELHGFKSLADINPDDYEEFNPDGMTALYDAAENGVSSVLNYGKILAEQDFSVNGAVYIITDGDNNDGSKTSNAVKALIRKAQQNEEVESIITILVGIKDPNLTGDDWAKHITKRLTEFQVEAELTQYLDVGDATAQRLAKLANWVSQSISSQSQSLGTGSASIPLSF